MRINNSEIQCFLRCRRKWFFEYVQGLRPKQDSEPLRLGTKMHEALELYYTGHDVPYGWFGEDVMLENTYRRYVEEVEQTGMDMSWEILEVEKTFELDFGNVCGEPVTLHGTLDLYVKDGYGRFLIVDHKLLANFSLYANRRLQLDPQLLTYTFMLREQGYPVDAGMLNMLRKVKDTTRAKPPFFQRELVSFNAEQVALHAKTLRDILKDIVQAREEHSYYPHVESSCQYMCSFMNPCVMMDNGGDVAEYLEENYAKEPELIGLRRGRGRQELASGHSPWTPPDPGHRGRDPMDAF